MVQAHNRLDLSGHRFERLTAIEPASKDAGGFTRWRCLPRPSPKHSIERIDNDGPYSPENCRWATPLEQARNKRGINVIEWRGERRALTEWCELLGIDYSVVKQRLGKLKWPVERAFAEPVRGRHV